MRTQRLSARQRLYTPEWDRARLEFLALHPDCTVCGRRVKLRGSRKDPMVGVVHHRVPHRGDPRVFWDRGNWRTVHRGCHDGPVQAAERTGRPMRGCDPSGTPLDPSHPWHK